MVKAALNPFEVKVNRRKHDVLGQRSKADSGLPGVSRSKAIQKVGVVNLILWERENPTFFITAQENLVGRA